MLEEVLVVGECDGSRAGAGREAVLLLRLPEQLSEHPVAGTLLHFAITGCALNASSRRPISVDRK